MLDKVLEVQCTTAVQRAYEGKGPTTWQRKRLTSTLSSSSAQRQAFCPQLLCLLVLYTAMSSALPPVLSESFLPMGAALCPYMLPEVVEYSAVAYVLAYCHGCVRWVLLSAGLL